MDRDRERADTLVFAAVLLATPFPLALSISTVFPACSRAELIRRRKAKKIWLDKKARPQQRALCYFSLLFPFYAARVADAQVCSEKKPLLCSLPRCYTYRNSLSANERIN